MISHIQRFGGLLYSFLRREKLNIFLSKTKNRFGNKDNAI